MEKLYCQSCGMPMETEQVLGTNADGSLNQDYCVYCYQKGAFLEPNITIQEMVDFCIPILVKEGFEEHAAQTMVQELIPKLKRWQTAQG